MINKKKIKDIIKKSLMIDVVISLLFVVVNPLNFNILEQIFFIFFIISLGIIINFSDYVKPISVIIIFLIVILFIFSGISYGHSNIQEKEKMSISPFIQNSFNPIENVNYSLLSGYTDINIQDGYIQYYFSGNTTSIFQNITTGKLISYNLGYQAFISGNYVYTIPNNDSLKILNINNGAITYITYSTNTYSSYPYIFMSNDYIIIVWTSYNGIQGLSYYSILNNKMNINTVYSPTESNIYGNYWNIYNSYVYSKENHDNYIINMYNYNSYDISGQSINSTSIYLSNYSAIFTVPSYGYSLKSNSAFSISENSYYYNTLNEIGVNQNLIYNHGKFYYNNITYNSSYIPNNLQYQSFYFQNGYIYFVDNGNLMSFQVNQFSIQVKSYSSIGTEINNYFLYNGNIYTKEYLNNTINIRILPLNYSVYYWTNGYIYINQSNPSFHSGIFYSYIVSIYYSQSQSAPQSPFSISTYIYPISMLFFFFMCSILIIGYIKYGGNKNGK
jgi:hypothetical protein